MRAVEFATQVEYAARAHLGSAAEQIVAGKLPDGDMLAVYQGLPLGDQIPCFQVFTAAARGRHNIVAGDAVPVGSTKVTHPSRSLIYGRGEDGHGTRGPWRIAFDLGIVALPPELSQEKPTLIIPRYERGISGVLRIAGADISEITPLPFY